jgi:trans-aconitate 2-methyltransferase
MIAAARADFPGLDFQIGRIEDFTSGAGAAGGTASADVVYSNAALHWVEDHESLMVSLLGRVAPRGVLAVQMPASFAEPSHTVARELCRDSRWIAKLSDALPVSPVAEPADYHRWLAPTADRLDVWETTYLHPLDGPDPVFQWFRGSWLRPVLTRLDEAEADAFEAEYSSLMAQIYPPDESGVVLLPFRRVFMVASPGDPSR